MDTQRFSRIANGLKSASISSVTQTADALRREGKEVLVFSIGRPDFDTPEHIKAAANDALAKGFVHYTHNRGILPMREAVAAYLKRQNGLDYDPKTEIMITAGAQEALMLCTHALLDPGDEVLVPSPGFLLYYSSIPMLHAVPVPYVLKEPDYDWDGAPVSDRTKLMIFNNPNNPTGKVFSAEEMRDAADFVKKHDLLAISDEAYDRLLYGDAKHRSLAAEPEKEVEAGYNILRAVGFPVAGPEVITCPTCGRTQYPCTEIANEVEKRLQGYKKSIKVAVMGCVVNGPGEAREADIGIAGGKGEAVLFIHGQPIKKLTGDNILDQFMEEIYKI